MMYSNELTVSVQIIVWPQTIIHH